MGTAAIIQRYPANAADFYIRKGMTLMELERFGEAVNAFHQGIVLDPKSNFAKRKLREAKQKLQFQ